ncbi:AarF/ABC1/UbiB kinase family protein [Verticiella sediminum]|uniref:AarF/ABC1/UbiB kinase family protein n=1 Tax=Verticiella sediminum TaxID=1247510 RepID=A0A556AS11_9BURK|nr:AarF/UbiB family protein [Verticiella sediminum]TSH95706.1 AarF/ABC1/UbiB kinase family protein [Verticiella sediminum]
MLETTWVALRDHARIRAIVAVLVRYGVQDVAVRLGLKPLLREPAGGGQTEAEAGVASLSVPHRLRLAIEELGPTFIKLGQILATRSDLLPPHWTEELGKLHSHASVLPWPVLSEAFEHDLGVPVASAFAQFDATPLAAASIAQVYRARLHSGEDVVVKIQRPGLRPTMQADLRLLGHLAALIENQESLRTYRPQDIVRYLASAMADELDFTREGQACERMRAALAGMPGVVVPRVFWEWTSERVLVQSFIEGVEPTDHAGLAAQRLDGPLLADRGARAFLKTVLHDGFFHADPHPGNLLAMTGDRVAFIDFGLVGRLSPRRREQLLVMLRAIIEGRSDDVASTLLEWSGATQFDWGEIDVAAQAFVARHAGGPLQLEATLRDFMAMARETGLALPPDLALLFKALITADGVLRELDPAFDVVRVARPMVQRELAERYSARTLRRQARGMLGELQGLALDVPQVARLAMYRIKHGQFGARVEIANLAELGRSLERTATRLALAIVVAAFVLALGPLLLNLGPRWLGMPVFALLGLLVAVGGLLALLWSFRRRE